MKPSGPGRLFFGRLLITVSISLLVISELRFSISSWVSLGRLHYSKYLDIIVIIPQVPVSLVRAFFFSVFFFSLLFSLGNFCGSVFWFTNCFLFPLHSALRLKEMDKFLKIHNFLDWIMKKEEIWADQLLVGRFNQ